VGREEDNGGVNAAAYEEEAADAAASATVAVQNLIFQMVQGFGQRRRS